MNPEPLKDKETCLNCLNTPCNCGMNNSAFIKGDVKSAVDWLKGRNDKQRKWLSDLKLKSKGELIQYIIETLVSFDKDINGAFEDVTKNDKIRCPKCSKYLLRISDKNAIDEHLICEHCDYESEG